MHVSLLYACFCLIEVLRTTYSVLYLRMEDQDQVAKYDLLGRSVNIIYSICRVKDRVINQSMIGTEFTDIDLLEDLLFCLGLN